MLNYYKCWSAPEFQSQAMLLRKVINKLIFISSAELLLNPLSELFLNPLSDLYPAEHQTLYATTVAIKPRRPRESTIAFTLCGHHLVV